MSAALPLLPPWPSPAPRAVDLDGPAPRRTLWVPGVVAGLVVLGCGAAPAHAALRGWVAAPATSIPVLSAHPLWGDRHRGTPPPHRPHGPAARPPAASDPEEEGTPGGRGWGPAGARPGLSPWQAAWLGLAGAWRGVLAGLATVWTLLTARLLQNRQRR
eukprot:EG_transcript_40122